MERIRLSQRKGSYKIEAEALLVGEDLVLSIWGGSKPHIGATALAVPRPSLKDPTVTSSTSSVLTRVGHKEDEIVKRVSERISAALGRTAVVSAGIHWDFLGEEDVEAVRSICEELTERLIHKILGIGK